jgi:hypothetical protein
VAVVQWRLGKNRTENSKNGLSKRAHLRIPAELRRRPDEVVIITRRDGGGHHVGFYPENPIERPLICASLGVMPVKAKTSMPVTGGLAAIRGTWTVIAIGGNIIIETGSSWLVEGNGTFCLIPI